MPDPVDASQPPTILIEPLDARHHLSATPIPWPSTPFGNKVPQTTVYVNQFGTAVLPNQVLDAHHPIEDYNLYFDDTGKLSLSASGMRTDLAFYEDAGPTSNSTTPGVLAATDTSGNRHGAALTNLTVDGTKPSLYASVQPFNGGGKGEFTLNVSGPPETELPVDPLSPKTNAASDGSDISGTNDYDFYGFKLARDGNYVFQVIPDNKPQSGEQTHLNASMNIYDSNGNPVAGTYTSTIASAGPGKTVSATLIGLKAGTTYWLRVDGVGDSTGGYGVACFLAPVTDVSVAATTPKATTARRGAGVITVTRVDNDPTPLTLNYTISGTAVAGVDYAPLSGTVTIPANQLSATISVTALVASTNGTDKTVVLTLTPESAYNIGPATTAGTATVQVA
jgi:hypothetical protein